MSYGIQEVRGSIPLVSTNLKANNRTGLQLVRIFNFLLLYYFLNKKYKNFVCNYFFYVL